MHAKGDRMNLLVKLTIAFLLIASTLGAAEIATIAGNGQAESSGDEGSPLQAGIGEPFGLTIGPDGALYVCSTIGHCVRRIDEQTGRITTVAGSGKKGYAGDGQPAITADCNEPYEVRFDNAGNMYFVEMQNHIIRRVAADSKKITTLAGTGRPGFSGDGGPAIAAHMKSPHSIALDGRGGLYVADIGNHRIRRVDLSSGIIDTFAGTGEKQPTLDGAPVKGTPLFGPRAIDFDSHQDLFLALREGHAVFQIDSQGQRFRHWAGTGKPGNSGDGAIATQAQLNGPKGIAIGPHGDVFLADTENHTIRVIRAKTRTMETIAGDGTPGDGPDGDPLKCRLNRPHGVFVDSSGVVYIGDSSNHKVRKLKPE
jgi:sugar lactone lactonase YvrE